MGARRAGRGLSDRPGCPTTSGRRWIRPAPNWPRRHWTGSTSGPREFTLLDTETELCGRILRRGYEERPDAPFFAYHERSLEDLPEPVLPAGFTVRPVRGEEDLEQRVAVHQAAWNSTRVTLSSYQAVTEAWPYRAGLDWVVEGPDGRFVVSCLIWHDDRNGVGLIEPIGTDPRYRRRGLSRAVCLAALHALREGGRRRRHRLPPR